MTPELKKKVDTLLIHGLYADDTSMSKMKEYLIKQGRTPESIYYPSDSSEEDVMNNYITPFIDNYPDADIVTHSTGGLLTRLYGQRPTNTLKGRNIVMLAPPLKGTTAARNTQNLSTALKLTPVLSRLTADLRNERNVEMLNTLSPDNIAGRDWKTIQGNISVLAGNTPNKGEVVHTLNKLMNSLTLSTDDKVTDGVVTLDNTMIPEVGYRAEVPYGHSDMLGQDEVFNKVYELLTKKKEASMINKAAYMNGYLDKRAGVIPKLKGVPSEVLRQILSKVLKKTKGDTINTGVNALNRSISKILNSGSEIATRNLDKLNAPLKKLVSRPIDYIGDKASAGLDYIASIGQ